MTSAGDTFQSLARSLVSREGAAVAAIGGVAVGGYYARKLIVEGCPLW